MKPLRLLETCTRYTATRNRYSDFLLTSRGIIRCLYRDISILNQPVSGAEEVTIMGIFWFDAKSGVAKGNVIGYLGQFYLIEHVTVAKQLVTSNTTHFIKCEVSLYRAIS